MAGMWKIPEINRGQIGYHLFGLVDKMVVS